MEVYLGALLSRNEVQYLRVYWRLLFPPTYISFSRLLTTFYVPIIPRDWATFPCPKPRKALPQKKCMCVCIFCCVSIFGGWSSGASQHSLRGNLIRLRFLALQTPTCMTLQGLSHCLVFIHFPGRAWRLVCFFFFFGGGGSQILGFASRCLEKVPNPMFSVFSWVL